MLYICVIRDTKRKKQKGSDVAGQKKDEMALLRELCDEVLSLASEIEKACDSDSEVTIGGNGVNSFEASATIRPLEGLARKAKTARPRK